MCAINAGDWTKVLMDAAQPAVRWIDSEGDAKGIRPLRPTEWARRLGLIDCLESIGIPEHRWMDAICDAPDYHSITLGSIGILQAWVSDPADSRLAHRFLDVESAKKLYTDYATSFGAPNEAATYPGIPPPSHLASPPHQWRPPLNAGFSPYRSPSDQPDNPGKSDPPQEGLEDGAGDL